MKSVRATAARRRSSSVTPDDYPIVNGTRDITADTDLRLCKFFGLSEGYFLRLQNAYDSLEARRRIAAQLAKIEPYKSA